MDNLLKTVEIKKTHNKNYLAIIASIGLTLTALRAGIYPASTPATTRIIVADITIDKSTDGLTNIEGPFPSTKDFSFDSYYCEVKTTTKRNVDTVEIHGIDQLDTPKGYKLFLPFIRSRKTIF